MGFNNFKRLFTAALASVAIGPALFSQTDFDVSIAKHKGNKIVLLGEWKPDDLAKWNQTLGYDEILGHGFILLDRSKFSFSMGKFSSFAAGINAFESWFRQKYGVSGADAWAALDFSNKFIVSGQQVPSPKEFDQMLERGGIKTPVRQLRDFLKENPGHLDAMKDLLNEVRRRALSVMPKGVDKDLDDETDLRTWAVMASETDKVFSGPWLGIDIDFFWVDRDQPEQFSKLMRATFRKHIPKVESAIRQDPTNFRLWNIWAWMARGMGNYKWETFINSIEPFYKELSSNILSCPSPEVCVWLVADSMAKKDWGMVAKLARIARRFGNFRKGEPESEEWTPGGKIIRSYSGEFPNVKHPFVSAFVPHLEALLMLGRIDEANTVYDEMLRWENSTNNNAMIVRFAAARAKAAGMDDLAKLWAKGELINKVPYFRTSLGEPFFIVVAEEGRYQRPAFAMTSSDYVKNLNEVLQKLNPPNVVSRVDAWEDQPALGWKVADGRKWGLIGEDGVLIAQGTEMPDVDDLQRVWNSLGVVSPPEWFRTYLAQHPDQPGMVLRFSSMIIGENILNKTRESVFDWDISKARPWGLDWVDDYEKAFGEAIRYLRQIVYDHPDILVNITSGFPAKSSSMAKAADRLATLDSSSFKALSSPMLSAIESLLERKPSSESLWNQWFFWRIVEGRDRSLESLVANLKHSPLSVNGVGLPVLALDMYWEECKKKGSWAKVAELLKGPWERELSRAMDGKKGVYGDFFSPGDDIGIPLIEAYLNDDRPGNANDVFNAWLATGNTFKDISAIVSLAMAKGQERLAKEWEAKVKK
jgi:hypothetical protein